MFGLTPRRRERRAERALMPRELFPLETLRREFGSLFNRAFAGWPMPFEPLWEEELPALGLDVEERETELVYRAELPGFEPAEIEVLASGDMLTIRAEHREEPVPEGKEPVARRYGRLERTVTLPMGVEVEKVEARYHNGVLEVHVPRTPEAKPRRIEVKT
jgi:HSP20 family protein